MSDSRDTPKNGTKRRDFLRGLALTVGASTLSGLSGCGEPRNSRSAELGTKQNDFQAGDVQHILPSVTHERMLLKVSFAVSRTNAPLLSVSGKVCKGQASDLEHRFFTFDISGLQPATQYQLRLHEADSTAITSTWPLKTFPAPDTDAASLRLLCITCAGGHDAFIDPRKLSNPLQPQFQPMHVRQRILARARSLAPDALLANGDHVYWDMRQSLSSWGQGRSPQARWITGFTPFDREQPVQGNANNEMAVKKAFGPQIADLYGTDFRSIPVFFLQDDHDYGDNDEIDAQGSTFPQDNFQRELTRFTQRLYYPELFAPAQLDAGFASDLGDGLAQSYGVLRYGRLVEGLLYDWMANWRDYELAEDSSADSDAKFIPTEIERWLIERSTANDALHAFHMPSTPVLWTARKWSEPYPDVLDDSGALSISIRKPYWPLGWNHQHDRLLGAASANHQRIPLFLSGDVHATALGLITRSNTSDYSANPVVSVLVGTPGSNLPAFPSAFRGTGARPSLTLETQELLKPLEQNGFSMVDFDRRSITISQYVWDVRTQPEGDIDSMSTVSVRRFDRPVG